jgi:uncharacterized protein (TIGR03437 family)
VATLARSCALKIDISTAALHAIDQLFAVASGSCSRALPPGPDEQEGAKFKENRGMARTIDCWFFPILFGAAFVGPAVCATVPAAIRISAETAPAGGWAQIKIFAVKPMAIASGHLLLNLDPTAFGNGAMVGLFGANGDAVGLATVTWPQIDIQFSSATGGIGQLAGLPVMVISVPVLASAAGRTVAVSATSPDSSVSVASGSVTVQGTIAVQKIPAGMGTVAAGTVVPVYGTGFTASTTVTIDGVELASTSFVSPQEVDVTLGGPAELVGKRARVADSGVEFDYFCFQPNDPVNFPEATQFGSAVANVQPLFPLFASTGLTGGTGASGYPGYVVEVQNPNQASATVSLAIFNVCCGPLPAVSPETLSIPAGSWAIFDGSDQSEFFMNSNLPVRVVAMNFCSASVALPVCLLPPSPFDANTILGAPVITPSSLAFSWQIGTSAPAARTVSLSGSLTSEAITTAAVTSGQSWLSVSPEGTPASTLSVSVNTSQLAVGTYQGSIMVNESYAPPATLPVSLTVSAASVPIISANPTTLSFTAPAFNAPPYSQTISVTSNSGPAAFSVALPPGSWLQVSPLSGTTPATLAVTWNPAVTSQIYYQQRSTPASISISGPGNAITVPAMFNVTGVQTFQTYLGASGMGPNGLVYSAQTGSSSQTQTINVDPAGAVSATADQSWVSVAAASQTVNVTVNPAGLAAGVYNGTVTIAEPGLASIAVPVTLSVWSSAPPLTITPGSFTFVQVVGEPSPAFQIAEADSGGVPVPLTILNDTNWLTVVDQYSAPAPVALEVAAAVRAPELPGQYAGSFTIQSPGGAAYVPVTLLVEPGPVALPVLSQVVNAASGIAGGVSPGELLSIRGYGSGAAAVSGLTLDASGMVVTSLNALQVTFDGQAAPLIYTSANQTNLIAPYEVAGKTSTVMQMVYAAAAGTLQTAAWVLPVVGSAPGVFTLDATGTGQAAVVNQDGTINSAANPADRGSVISIYATGEGQTSPAGVTGSVTQSNTKTPLLPVTATIGGIGATVQYAGSAPDEVAGLLQVNAVVPQGVGPGSSAPVVVSVGGIATQASVTIAVK